MIHIYTGNGKGKTTSAFGLAMRSSGQGLKVIIFQFLKPKALVTGEEISAKKIKNLKIVKFNQKHPMFEVQGSRPLSASLGTGNNRRGIKKSIEKAVIEAGKVILSGRYDMVILDEIINVIDQGFAGKKEFLGLIKKAPEGVELVLTGRGNISDIEQFADYITIMIDKKHPFRQRVDARRGIEY